MSSSFTHGLLALPLAVEVSGWDYLVAALGLLSFIVAVGAIGLAIRQSRELSEVKRGIEEAQNQTISNLDKTEEVGRQTLQALGLHENLVGPKDLAESINDLAADYGGVLELDDDFLRKRADQTIDQARTYIHMAAQGELDIGPEALAADEEIPCALLEMTKEGDQFWASSAVDSSFWARAGAYLQLQEDRIREGVEIRRVFIFKDEESFLDEEAQQQLRFQIEKRIVVHATIEKKGNGRDLVALARPSRADSQTEDSDDSSGKTPLDILYAAEFNIAAGRVDKIELWSAAAGHHQQRVTRMWNILNGFYNNSKAVIIGDNGELTKVSE